MKGIVFLMSFGGVGCVDAIDDGIVITPTMDQTAMLDRQHEATLALFQEKQETKRVATTAGKAKRVKKANRSS